MKKVLLVPALVCTIIVGCSAGIEVKNFKPAQGPQGVQMEIKLYGDVIKGDKVEGELLAVRADGVLLKVAEYPVGDDIAERVVLIPFWMMDTARLEQMGRAKVESQGEDMNDVYLKRLRLVSRFPQGLSDELLGKILTSLDQDTLVVPHNVE